MWHTGPGITGTWLIIIQNAVGFASTWLWSSPDTSSFVSFQVSLGYPLCCANTSGADMEPRTATHLLYPGHHLTDHNPAWDCAWVLAIPFCTVKMAFPLGSHYCNARYQLYDSFSICWALSWIPSTPSLHWRMAHMTSNLAGLGGLQLLQVQL